MEQIIEYIRQYVNQGAEALPKKVIHDNDLHVMITLKKEMFRATAPDNFIFTGVITVDKKDRYNSVTTTYFTYIMSYGVEDISYFKKIKGSPEFI